MTAPAPPADFLDLRDRLVPAMIGLLAWADLANAILQPVATVIAGEPLTRASLMTSGLMLASAGLMFWMRRELRLGRTAVPGFVLLALLFAVMWILPMTLESPGIPGFLLPVMSVVGFALAALFGWCALVPLRRAVN